jgi:hypothetical protein
MAVTDYANVTPNEIATTLGISPKKLRDWLRARARQGKIEHIWYARWYFTQEEAESIVRIYRGA